MEFTFSDEGKRYIRVPPSGYNDWAMVRRSGDGVRELEYYNRNGAKDDIFVVWVPCGDFHQTLHLPRHVMITGNETLLKEFESNHQIVRHRKEQESSDFWFLLGRN